MPHITGDFESGRVWINGRELYPSKSQKVQNHSPDGFSWGYGGSGPAQLALAILLEYFPRNIAVQNYQDFKWKVIANLPRGASFNVYVHPQDMVNEVEEVGDGSGNF